MAEASDFIGAPFNFGRCEEAIIPFTATCGSFAEPDTSSTLILRKRGDWVTLSFPSILKFSKTIEERKDSAEFISQMMITPEGLLPYLGDEPRYRFHECIARVIDHFTKEPRTVPAMLAIHRTGIIEIIPDNTCFMTDQDGSSLLVQDKKGFNAVPGKQVRIGLISANITFCLNDNHQYAERDMEK